VRAKQSGTYKFQTRSDDGVRLSVYHQEIIANWTDHSATDDSGSLPLDAGTKYPITLEYYQNLGAATIQLSWQPPGETTLAIIPTAELYPPRVLPADPPLYLDALYPQILPDSWLVLSIAGRQELYYASAVTADSRQGFTLSAKTTRVDVQGPSVVAIFNYHVRDTVVFARNDLLPLADAPRTTPVQGNSVELDTLIDAPPAGRSLLVCGQAIGTGSAGCELATLQAATVVEGRSVLTLTDTLAGQYDPPTVTVFANVAAATHGETTSEVLGSGDAGSAFQRFTLRQAPVTYVSAPTPDGAASTLQLWVNDIQWTEVPALYGAGPRDRVFITRRDDAGKSTALFGDGTAGARLPSGQENVRAVYRKGLGSAGMVKEGQLSLLMTRPLGVKAVTNPAPADGALDPQTQEEARADAPVTVLTLGRVVSLQDYEDFARAFAGVGKAHAEWVWDGHTRGVVITIIGPGGAAIPEKGTVIDRLLTALQQARDRLYPIHLQPTQPVSFEVRASLTVASDRIPDKVVAQARAALQDRFSFTARAFGQEVTLGEVTAVLQAVPGVVAVNVTALYRAGDPAALNPVLSATVPRPGQDIGSVQPAELLMLAADSLAGVEVTS
jgi:predicted phage baseplate assembly protein